MTGNDWALYTGASGVGVVIGVLMGGWGIEHVGLAVVTYLVICAWILRRERR